MDIAMIWAVITLSLLAAQAIFTVYLCGKIKAETEKDSYEKFVASEMMKEIMSSDLDRETLYDE